MSRTASCLTAAGRTGCPARRPRPVEIDMKRIASALAIAIAIGGCQSPQKTARTHARKYGPPPPGYIKIRGEAVPNWRPELMHADPRGALNPLQWEPLGPRPIENEGWSGGGNASGRVPTIAPHPTDPNTVYIGSASGGVWKTTDGGANWIPLTDELANLNHGCVAIDPSNPDTIYAGTGEYTTYAEGDGLFRSTNGGVDWERVATAGQVGTTCSRVIVDPSNPLRIHVTGNYGYVRSDDGGANWTNHLSGAASDMTIDPESPQVVFVARHGVGIYRSTDGGNSFTQLTNGLPGSGADRILLAIAPSKPDSLYAALMNGGGLLGLYKSTDGGDSWSQLSNTPDFPYPQAWYDAFVAVDPTNENIVYCGGVFPSYAVAGVIKTTNGGASWTDITYNAGNSEHLHPDQHTMAFGPDGTIWVGNDGGVWKSVDGGANWINTNATLTVTQNYTIALHPTNPARMIAGTQDNGTVARTNDVLQWPQIVGGDGGFAAYDHADAYRRYTTYVYLAVFRLDLGFADITGPWGGDPANFIAPLVMDPNDSHVLVGGTNRVWRTTNAHAGADWTAVSGTNVSGGGILNAIAIAPSDSNTIYTGSSTGKVYKTTDLSNWSAMSGGLPSGQISDICVDPQNAELLYVAYHNTSGGRVYRKNPGLLWTSVTGDLPPGVSARALAVDWRFDPPHLYIGSGVGVYASIDGGATWIKDGLDLPNVNIGDLAIDFERGTITAGTYGRGAWRADLPLPCDLIGDVNDDGQVNSLDIACFVECWTQTIATPACHCGCAYPDLLVGDAVSVFVAALLGDN